MSQKHYLESELEALLCKDGALWQFLRGGSLNGCWYWDLENPDNEWMSPEFWRLLGIDPDSKRHNPAEWQDVIFPEDLLVAQDNFNRHCADPDHPYDQVVRYRHADGSTVWVRCRGMAIRDENGKPIRMLGAHNDLTAIKRAEQHAISDKLKAESITRELRAFSCAVTHDLKAPIGTLRALLEEIQHGSGDRLEDADRQLLDRGIDVVERIEHLVDDVTDVSRLLREKPDSAEIDLKQMAETVLDDHSDAIHSAEALIHVGELPSVIGIGTQLQMLLSNLIGNALKYRSPKRPLEITIGADFNDDDDRLRLFVRDNGMGIAPKDQRHIFELFKRLHRHDEIPGTGLGLALCQRIAEHHGTRIEVDSYCDAGAEFSLELERSPQTLNGSSKPTARPFQPKDLPIARTPVL